MLKQEVNQVGTRLRDAEAEKLQLKRRLDELSIQLASQQSDSGQQRMANETQLTEMMERIRGKELVIDQNASEMR